MTERFSSFLTRFGWPDHLNSKAPLAIAHRGASDHTQENTLKAFQVASDLGSELWEIDVRVSADGICVVSHDGDLQRIVGSSLVVSETAYETLRAVRLPDNQHLPRLEEVIALAEQLGAGLYIELKDERAGPEVLKVLQSTGFTFAAIGAFAPDWIADLRALNCPYPLSVLVPKGTDPLVFSTPARPDIIHLCWLGAGERPDELVTDALIAAIHASGTEVVTWHEDRAEVIAALQAKPILGICSNRPEVLKPKRSAAPQIVCHRGANAFAPENTLPAARICIDQKMDFVELDVRTTRDGHLIVMHDKTVDRTTDGTGLVSDLTLKDIKGMDAGHWFGDHYTGVKVPTFEEFLSYTKGRCGLYVEIKQADPAQILTAIDKHAILANCFFWCGDRTVMRALRSLSEDAVLMATRWMYQSVQETAADYNAQIIEFDVRRDDLDELAEAKALGLKTMIYSQSHDWDDLASYSKYSPDMMNLDRPDRFKLLTDYDAKPQPI